jgi:hypothetical protein
MEMDGYGILWVAFQLCQEISSCLLPCAPEKKKNFTIGAPTDPQKSPKRSWEFGQLFGRLISSSNAHPPFLHPDHVGCIPLSHWHVGFRTQ